MLLNELDYTSEMLEKCIEQGYTTVLEYNIWIDGYSTGHHDGVTKLTRMLNGETLEEINDDK